MKKLASLFLLLGLVGCARGAPAASASPQGTTTSLPSTPDPRQPMPETSAGTNTELTRGASSPVVVDGRADIFSAGQTTADAERGGVLPSRLVLPEGARSIRILAAGGLVGCGEADPSAGPRGASCAGGVTRIESAGGISGIADATRTQFLVGVFLAGAPPSTAPAALDLSPGEPGLVASRTPQLGQTFYVGEGEHGPVTIPQGATHLYLGFADGWTFQGPPSYYADNSGGFGLTVVAD